MGTRVGREPGYEGNVPIASSTGRERGNLYQMSGVRSK